MKHLCYQLTLFAAFAGCTSALKVVDLTEPDTVCSLHGVPLQTEEKQAWYGTVSCIEPFDFEDYKRFPYANDRPIALRDRKYEFVESAKISFCPECRRIKDAELAAIKERRASAQPAE